MFARHGIILLLSAVLVVAAGCSNKDKDKDHSGKDGKVLSGKVVNQPGGGPGIERWRFQPKGQPDTYLRLTRALMQQAVTPESMEIKLDEWAGQKIRVKHQQADSTWVWGAEIVK